MPFDIEGVGELIKIAKAKGKSINPNLKLGICGEHGGNPNSICYIKTSNLDGETNLKIRQGLNKTSHLLDSIHLSSFSATIECEGPNQHLYEFSGNLKISNEQSVIPIGSDQILLRGSLLQNTKWVYGIVIYTGHETKLMMNSSSPPFKRSQVEKTMNTQVNINLI